MIDWINHKFSVSINKRLVNKNELNDNMAFIEGFENLELTPGELKAAIESGFAYSSVYSGNRSAENFVRVGFLSLDFDNEFSEETGKGYSLDALLNSEFVKQNATLLYKTSSHSSEQPRFRIVFVLERPIENKNELRAILRSLALRLGSDIQATDPARLFYGNSHSASVLVRNNGLNEIKVKELLDQSLGFETSESSKTSHRSSGQSRLRMKPNLSVTTASGETGDYSSLAKSTSIYCPYHDDKHPSAFIIESKGGAKGIHCNACSQSFWSEPQTYDFTTFDQAMEYLPKTNTTVAAADDQSALSNAKNLDILIPSGITERTLTNTKLWEYNSKYLEISTMPDGLNFVKSPKGTGKTEMVSKLVNDPNRATSVLLVGHRRSLIRHLCERLNLSCYLDNYLDKKRLGICLDSIDTLHNIRSYDYVIVDESEQVLAHFLSETMNERRNKAFQYLVAIVKGGKSVIALDADMDWTSFRFFTGCNRAEGLSTDSHIHLNKFKAQRPNIKVFDSSNHLVGKIHSEIQANARCFITSNSKTKIESVGAKLKRDFPAKKFLIVTSETSSREEVQSFLNDTRKQTKQYDAILATPSISTGVDISFENNEEVFDHVFGLFLPNITTHFECDQQIARVRHPKNISVFLSPVESHFETNLVVVNDDLIRGELANETLKGFDGNGRPRYDPHSALLRLGCDIVSIRRASKNRLKANFIDHMTRQGFQTERVPADDLDAEIGKAFLKQGKLLNEEETIRRLTKAKRLTEMELQMAEGRLSGGDTMPIALIASLHRTCLELFYRRPISPELIAFDDNTRMRQKIRLLDKMIVGTPNYSRELEYEFLELNGVDAQVHKSPVYKTSFLCRAFEKAEIWDTGGFRTTQILDNNTLANFSAYMKNNRTTYAGLFERNVRDDIDEKPMQQLNALLGFVGLKMENVGTETILGKKNYKYGFEKISDLSPLQISRVRIKNPGTIEYLEEKYPLLDGDIQYDN